MLGEHTVTNSMQQGLIPARVCLANSASLNQANLSPAITTSTRSKQRTISATFQGKFSSCTHENTDEGGRDRGITVNEFRGLKAQDTVPRVGDSLHKPGYNIP